jgi:hypothetical protein
MDRIQCSNDSGKGFACSLKNLVRDRVDREGFVGSLYIPYQIATSVSEIS